MGLVGGLTLSGALLLADAATSAQNQHNNNSRL
jgi:hypothetical protein